MPDKSILCFGSSTSNNKYPLIKMYISPHVIDVASVSRIPDNARSLTKINASMYRESPLRVFHKEFGTLLEMELKSPYL